MKRKAIVVEKAPGRLSLALDLEGLPSGCCGSSSMEDEPAGAQDLTPAEAEDKIQSACAACSSKSCSHMHLFPISGGKGDFINLDVEDSSPWKLGQQVVLEFPLSSAILSTLLSILLPLGLATGLFFFLASLFPRLPPGLTWLFSLLGFAAAAWPINVFLLPRIAGKGVRLSPDEDCALG